MQETALILDITSSAEREFCVFGRILVLPQDINGIGKNRESSVRSELIKRMTMMSSKEFKD